MKIVFLIDLKEETCERSYVSEVVFVALRLLSFFNSNRSNVLSGNSSFTIKQRHDKNKKSSLKWGFKFYSSEGSFLRSKLNKQSSTFCDSWNCESFTNFQKKTELLLSNKTTDKRKSITHPSDQLSTALTEILHDFEWQDKTDLSKSPAATRSSRKRPHLVSDNTSDFKDGNFVFIFSEAPSSRHMLRQFANKIVMDSDVFVDSFMSPALLKEYKENSRIRLYWIDFESLCEQAPLLKKGPTVESLKIVKDAFKKLGGDLLHKREVLKKFTCNEFMPCFSGANLPVEACSSEALLLDGIPGYRSSSNSSLLQDCSLTILSGTQKFEFRDAKLASMVSKRNELPKESKQQRFVSLSEKKTRIELRGCIPVSEVDEIIAKCGVDQTSVLICDDQSNGGLLLNTFLKSQALGILEITTACEMALPQVGILSALTSTCGHIFCLSLDQQIDIEAAVLFKPPESVPQADTLIKKEGKDTQSSYLHIGSSTFASPVLNSWHKPGSLKLLGPLIRHLKKSSHDSKPSSCTKEVVECLKKLYLKKNQEKKLPLNQTSTPVSEPPVAKTSGSGASVEQDSGSAQARRLSRRSSSSLSRGRLMVDKARSASISTGGDEDASNHSLCSLNPEEVRRTSGSVGFENLSVKTEEELLGYLKKQYSLVLGAGVAMEASIRALVTVASYFMSTQEKGSPQAAAVAFIHKNLVLDPSELKKKYVETDADKTSHVVEYKLQVILLLEIASFIIDCGDLQEDKVVGKLVTMLRVLSFITGPTSLQEFMANTAESYCSTLPKVLMEVFDELDLPYPPCLEKLASPSAPSTVWGANHSVSSVDSFISGPGSSQPSSSQHLSQGSRRSRLKQHPSLSDFRQKKQILVEKPKANPTSKSEGTKMSKQKSKQKRRSSRSSHVDFGNAKRNLFSDKSKPNQISRTKVNKQLTPKRKSGKAKLLVPGTPANKQTSERILSKQRRLREHLNIKPEVQVVAESPVKDTGDLVGGTNNRPARYILRESFYSSSSSRQSRIVAKSMESVERGESQPASSDRYLRPSKSHGSLSSAVRGESPILSPRTSIMRSFLASPGSERKGEENFTSSPPSHLPRRSPRKSVKKLLFDPSGHDTSKVKFGAQRKSQNSLEVQLVFDGENASDVLPSGRQSKSQVARAEGLKTPEKKKPSLKSDWWDSASCPTLQVTPTKSNVNRSDKRAELGFKNCFSSKDLTTIFDKASASASYRCSDESGSNKSPLKTGVFHISTKSRTFSKISESRNNENSFYSNNGKSNINSPLKRKSLLAEKRKNSSHAFSGLASNTHCQSQVSNVRVNEVDSVNDDEVVLSTPKKRSAKTIYTTPSKVHFSDNCLISPPTGSGRPVSTTPQRSILKGSPAAKKSNFAQRIEFAESDGPSSSDTLFIRKHQSNPETFSSQCPTLNLCISKRDEEKTSATSQENGSDVPNSSPRKKQLCKTKIPRFDPDSSLSNSSNDDSQCVRDRPSASTVVTAHTPSPGGKKKTPESINKWMRRKRHSGSKTVSGSSSSSSESPSSSSSNEIQDKTTSHLAKGQSTSESYVKEKLSSAQAEERSLKRNLFSKDHPSPDNAPPPLKQRKLCVDKKTIEAGTAGRSSQTKIGSHLSGGFSVIGEGVFSQNTETSRSWKRSTSELQSLSSSSVAAVVSVDHHFSPNRSLSKESWLLWPSNSSFGEGSQGFFVQTDSQSSDNAQPPSCSHGKDSDAVSAGEIRMSEMERKVTDSRTIPESKSPSQGRYPVQSESPTDSSSCTSPRKKQFSPALSTSGLLQLIRSPLLDGQERQTRASRRLHHKPKSKKVLDLQ